jgi:hypothetical protein
MFSYIYHINMVCSMLLRTELRLYHLNLEITRWRYLKDLSQLTKSINQKSNPSTVTTSMYFSSGCTDSPAPRSALYSFSWGSAPAEDSTGKPWAVSRLSPEQCGGSERNQHLCALHTHHRLIRPDWPKEWWAARPQHTCFGPFSLASC